MVSKPNGIIYTGFTGGLYDRVARYKWGI